MKPGGKKKKGFVWHLIQEEEQEEKQGEEQEQEQAQGQEEEQQKGTPQQADDCKHRRWSLWGKIK